MIRLDGVSKTFRIASRRPGLLGSARSLFNRDYRYVRALEGVSFTVPDGTVVGYIGPNGAGKSTTIKIMSGILVPDEGECEIDGFCPWRDREKYVSRIGVVFGQRTQLWWDVPVMDSFELLRDIYRIRPGDYKARLKRLTEALSLEEFISSPLRSLSLGQRMRCELAASLLHAPRILFLDEPTIGLDALSKLAVRRFIRQVNEEDGVSVVLTTHDMTDIEALTNRIILIGRGRILHDGAIGGIRGRFGGARTLEIDFREGERPPDIENVEISERRDGHVTLKLGEGSPPAGEIVSRFAGAVTMLDMKVSEMPIEEIIARMYEEYAI